jgi:hypothetical protein
MNVAERHVRILNPAAALELASLPDLNARQSHIEDERRMYVVICPGPFRDRNPHAFSILL